MSNSLSRRRFVASTAGALGVLPVLAACGGGGPDTAAGCDGYSALSEADLATRNALNYVDETPNPEQLCGNCRLYTTPEQNISCGGCQLFAGPVLPGGYCTGWAAMSA